MGKASTPEKIKMSRTILSRKEPRKKTTMDVRHMNTTKHSRNL